MIRKSALCHCLMLGAAMTAMGCGRQECLDKCRSGNSDAKIVGCTELIQAGRDTPGEMSAFYNNRGAAYVDKGDYDRAIQDFNESIGLDRNNAIVYYNDGFAYEKKGDYDRAIQVFNEAIHQNPNLERAYYGRGTAYSFKDDDNRAIKDLGEAIRLDPNDASAYSNRGTAFLKKNDYGSAIQDYTHAIRLDSNFTGAYLGRGNAYFGQPNLTAAIADYEHTISAAPSSPAAFSAAVILHVIMKRQGHDDAQQLARAAAAADLSKWPGPVGKLYLGQMTAEEVLMTAASSGTDREKKWQVCEANYFTGEDALFHQQRATALARLKAARDGCPKGEMGYGAALAELKRLGASNTPPK